MWMNFANLEEFIMQDCIGRMHKDIREKAIQNKIAKAVSKHQYIIFSIIKFRIPYHSFRK